MGWELVGMFFAGLFMGLTAFVIFFGITQSDRNERNKEAVKNGFVCIDGVYYRLTRIGLWDENKDDVWKKVWGDESYYD